MKNSVKSILILCLALCICREAGHVYGADEAAGRKKELQRMRREMQEKKREIRRTDRTERTVLADIEKLDKAIQTGSAELADQQRRLREAEAVLKGIEANSGELALGLGRLKSLYRERVRALYKTGRLGYAAAVLSAESFSTALKRIKYLGIIIERDYAVITNYREVLDTLAAKQTQIRKAKEEILHRKHAVEAARAGLGVKRSKKVALLTDVRQKKEWYEESLRELEEASANLWVMIKRAEEEKKAARRAQRGKPGTAADSVQGKGRLPWPVAGPLLTRFGMQRHPQFGTMVFRRGVEIGARPGDRVYAVSEGQVAYADWHKGYGKLVILDHGSGIFSLYGHLESLNCAKDERVLKGQMIGLVGDTGGVKEPRLYFEIRRNGEAQDPLNWLAPKQTVLR